MKIKGKKVKISTIISKRNRDREIKIEIYDGI